MNWCSIQEYVELHASVAPPLWLAVPNHHCITAGMVLLPCSILLRVGGDGGLWLALLRGRAQLAGRTSKNGD